MEVLWRLAPEFWHRGYATEAAQAALADGLERLELGRILAFTVPADQPSRSVMDRLGMTRDALRLARAAEATGARDANPVMC